MTNFNEEAIAKAKQAKSVEELLALAKESGVEMTAEQAQDIFAQFNQKSGELADDELDNVAGGGCYNEEGYLIVSGSYICGFYTCPCGSTETTMSRISGRNIFCSVCGRDYGCGNCSYCISQGGYKLCSHPSNKH